MRRSPERISQRLLRAVPKFDFDSASEDECNAHLALLRKKIKDLYSGKSVNFFDYDALEDRLFAGLYEYSRFMRPSPMISLDSSIYDRVVDDSYKIHFGALKTRDILMTKDTIGAGKNPMARPHIKGYMK